MPLLAPILPLLTLGPSLPGTLPSFPIWASSCLTPSILTPLPLNLSDCGSDAVATQSDATDAFAIRSVSNGSDGESDATATVDANCAPADAVTAFGSVSEESDRDPQVPTTAVRTDHVTAATQSVNNRSDCEPDAATTQSDATDVFARSANCCHSICQQ